VTVYETP